MSGDALADLCLGYQKARPNELELYEWDRSCMIRYTVYL